MAGFLRGDPEALATVDGWLVRAAGPYRRRLGERWQDVLQDLRLEVTRLFQQGRFRGEASLKTYLYRVVGHACLNHIRAREKWHWTELEPGAMEDETAPRRTGERVEWGTRDLLLRILARVSEDCRRLWSMILEGYDYREMSDRLGVSPGALRVRVLRCRRRAVELRSELGGSQRTGT